ncbi:MAG: peptidase domain-containing ABC transporter [Tannerella sp.]|jgi:ATP-binding cassette subfamily B protein|nr:peptidase domain-containing ABC transporter [Tannerella sp.]
MIKDYRKYFVRQHGEYYCGLACLSMIVKYYGGNVRQEDLRTASGTSLQGTTLLGLYQAAGKLNLMPEGYEADMSSLKTLKVPVILHIIKDGKIEHYVVCFGYDGEKFTIGDPAESGITCLTEAELNILWKTRALLTLEPTRNFIRQAHHRKEKFLWFKNIVKEDSPLLSVAFVLGVIISLLGLSTAIFSQQLIDVLLPSMDLEKIILGVALFFILLVSRSGLDFLRNIFMLRQARNINNRLVDSFFAKILYLPKSFFDSVKTGEIIARMNDSRRIQHTLSYIVSGVLIEVLILLFSIIYLLFYSWKMALIASACIPFFVLPVLLYNRKIVDGQRNVMTSYAATEGLFIDIVQGVNDIKTTNKQGVFRQSVKLLYGVFQDFTCKLGILGSQYGFISQIISIVTSILLMVFGIMWVLSGQLKLGELMAIITVGSMIISSTANLSGVNIRLHEAGVAFDRFFEFVKTAPEFEPDEEIEKIERETTKAHLEIKNISFRFVGRKRLLENVSMEVRKGEIVALLGEVGSGKSTLIQILQKYYHVEDGEILFNGKSLSDYFTPIWREYIGVVSQQTKIFSATVGENICLGNFAGEQEHVMQFCKNYGFNTYFDDFPQGLNTLTGEDGINLSGGQQQLIGFARALYRSPLLLLLDEPTSAMDVGTEKFVINLLQQKSAQFATLMVTHRSSLADISTRIYRLGAQ